MSDATSRVLRTIIQLIASGALTALFEQIAKDVPPAYTPYVLLVSMLVVTICQNYLEQAGVIPPILKGNPPKSA